MQKSEVNMEMDGYLIITITRDIRWARRGRPNGAEKDRIVRRV